MPFGRQKFGRRHADWIHVIGRSAMPKQDEYFS
jgi:hypothetical protein